MSRSNDETGFHCQRVRTDQRAATSQQEAWLPNWAGEGVCGDGPPSRLDKRAMQRIAVRRHRCEVCMNLVFNGERTHATASAVWLAIEGLAW